jgi:protein-arginine kinase activator protein McsA
MISDIRVHNAGPSTFQIVRKAKANETLADTCRTNACPRSSFPPTGARVKMPDVHDANPVICSVHVSHRKPSWAVINAVDRKTSCKNCGMTWASNWKVGFRHKTCARKVGILGNGPTSRVF